MPRMELCGRRVGASSDDFVGVASCAAISRSLWLAGAVVAERAVAGEPDQCPAAPRGALAAAVAVLAAGLVSDLLLALCSARGTMLEVAKRRAVPALVLADTAFFVLDLIVLAGAFRLFFHVPFEDCRVLDDDRVLLRVLQADTIYMAVVLCMQAFAIAMLFSVDVEPLDSAPASSRPPVADPVPGSAERRKRVRRMRGGASQSAGLGNSGAMHNEAKDAEEEEDDEDEDDTDLQLDEIQSVALGEAQERWTRRCRFCRCCWRYGGVGQAAGSGAGGAGDGEGGGGDAEALERVGVVLASALATSQELHLTATDVAAGLALVRMRQRLAEDSARQLKLSEQLAHEVLASASPPSPPGTNASVVARRPEAASTARPVVFPSRVSSEVSVTTALMHPRSKPSFQRLANSVSMDLDQPWERQALWESARYIEYALAAYGHLLYTYANASSVGCAKLACRACYAGTCEDACTADERLRAATRTQRVQTSTAAARLDVESGLPTGSGSLPGSLVDSLREAQPLHEGDCCGCNMAAVRLTTGRPRSDFLAARFHSSLTDRPFLVAVDAPTRALVVAIRGTLSMSDAMADADAIPFDISDDPATVAVLRDNQLDTPAMGDGCEFRLQFFDADGNPESRESALREGTTATPAFSATAVAATAVSPAAGAGGAGGGASAATAASSAADVARGSLASMTSLPAGSGVAFVHQGMWVAAQSVARTLRENRLLDAARPNRQDGEEPLQLIITGHSLGAGVATLLTLLLKPEFPGIRCYAMSPPGGLLSPLLAEALGARRSPVLRWSAHASGVDPGSRGAASGGGATAPRVGVETPFLPTVTSVVLGKDIIPRLSVRNLHRLQVDMLEAILGSHLSKAHLFSSALCVACTQTAIRCVCCARVRDSSANPTGVACQDSTCCVTCGGVVLRAEDAFVAGTFSGDGASRPGAGAPGRTHASASPPRTFAEHARQVFAKEQRILGKYASPQAAYARSLAALQRQLRVRSSRGGSREEGEEGAERPSDGSESPTKRSARDRMRNLRQFLCMGGRVLHLVKTETRWASVCGSCCADREYEAVWAPTLAFDHILVSSLMFGDHLPDKVERVLQRVVECVYPMSRDGFGSVSGSSAV